MIKGEKEELYNLRYLLNKDLDLVELDIMNRMRNGEYCTEQIQERQEIRRHLKEIQDEINK